MIIEISEKTGSNIEHNENLAAGRKCPFEKNFNEPKCVDRRK